MERLDHQRAAPGRVHLERDRAAPDQEEAVGRLALAEQVSPRRRRARCAAAGDQLELVALPARRTPARRRSAPQSSASGRSSLSRIARGLLGDVDPDRAPGDAAPAADAARAAELVDPGRELVRHPLPVARARRAAHGAAVDVRVVDREAGVPALVALDVLAGQVGARPRPSCRSTSGRPSCSCRRSGSARRPRPSADARSCGRAAP